MPKPPRTRALPAQKDRRVRERTTTAARPSVHGQVVFRTLAGGRCVLTQLVGEADTTASFVEEIVCMAAILFGNERLREVVEAGLARAKKVTDGSSQDKAAARPS